MSDQTFSDDSFCGLWPCLPTKFRTLTHRNIDQDSVN